MSGAENPATMILGQPFYIRTSLKNTTPIKHEIEEFPKREAYVKNDYRGKRDDNRGGDYYRNKGDKWGKEPVYPRDRDRATEYVVKQTGDQYTQKNLASKGDAYRDMYDDRYRSKPEYNDNRNDNRDKKKPRDKDHYYDTQYKQKAEVANTKNYYNDTVAPKEYNRVKDDRTEPKTRTTNYKDDKPKTFKNEFQNKKYDEEYTKKPNTNKKPRVKPQNLKEPALKLTILDPQDILNQQRASKNKGKHSYATPNIFELLEVSD